MSVKKATHGVVGHQFGIAVIHLLQPVIPTGAVSQAGGENQIRLSVLRKVPDMQNFNGASFTR